MVSDFENIKNLSHDFPMKETLLWDDFKYGQVKLHSEHDKTVSF